jgi:glycosyltransferase involved in cell wall biosynthesis
MNSFTGRCAYAYDCDAFIAGCSAQCPTPDEYPALAPAKIAPAWQSRKTVLLDRPRIHAVAPSHWLASEAIRGFWSMDRVHVIPYAVSLDTYVPIDRSQARRELGLPEDGRPVIALSAQDLADRRKGGRFIATIFAEPSLGPVRVIGMGGGQLTFDQPNIDWHGLGFIDEPRRQSLVYSAADVLLHPAIADNLPNVVIEALACGTPVAAFHVGGLPEMILPGRTGWLSPLEATTLGRDLARLIKETRGREDVRQACRAFAETHYDPQRIRSQYEFIFESVVSTTANRRRAA